MFSDFKYLIELQDIDMKILDLEKSKEEYPKTVEDLQKTISDAEAFFVTIKKREEEIKKEKSTIEEQKADSQVSLTKSQERLNTIKTNKEYDAVHAEIETHKIFILQADKRIQKLNADAESVEKKFLEAQAAHEKIIAENQPKIDELNAKIATIDSSITEVGTGRESLIQKISKPYFRTYNHIRIGRKKGRVISVVNQTDRTCTVCFQMLQPQVVNRLRKGAELMQCQSCGSILIWKDRITENAAADTVNGAESS